MMSVIGPMKKFDPLPIPFQSVLIKSAPIETESEKNRDPIDQHRHRCDPIFGRLPLTNKLKIELSSEYFGEL